MLAATAMGWDERHDPEKPGYIWTYTGRCFWSLDPRACDVAIEDIAHHLSMQCRYGGAVRWHYSVAEHCVRVSLIVPPAHALSGLLHDASEAYLIDVPRPVKLGLQPLYSNIEGPVHRVICEAFGVSPVIPPEVHVADNVLAVTEMRDLMHVPRPNNMHLVSHGVEPLRDRIYPWPQESAEAAYLLRFEELRARADH